MERTTSSRNSEVIHAGIYYAANSLKARLCVTGNKLLYAYCDEKGIAHKRCGKLIVACGTEQVAQLTWIADKAQTNGVTDLVRLERNEARRMEPELVCDAALLSPSTGIVDSHALMLALQADLENAGGMVVLRCALARANVAKNAVELMTDDGTTLRCNVLVNAAGLLAPALDPARGDAFYSEVRKYWPGLKDGALLPAYAGIRPKISGPNDPARDFLIQGPQHHGQAGLVNLFGIESPGLTSALAIGQEVLTLLKIQ